MLNQGVFGCNRGISDSHDSIRARCKNSQRRMTLFHRNIKVYPFRSSNPVPLHGFDRFRPTWKVVQFIQQFVRVSGSADEPLWNFPSFDYCSRAPPSSVAIHLFICKHRLFYWIPVNGSHFAICQILFNQTRKKPLLPLVVFGSTSCQFTRPVICEAESLQLAFHVGDILVSPLRCRNTFCNGGVFCW